MTSEIESKIKPPAIGLIVAGILSLPIGVYFVLSVVFQLMVGEFNRPFADDAARTAFYVLFYGIGVLGLLVVAIAIVLIYGGMQMLKGKKYGFVRIASILSIFIILPVGIWSFIILRSPDVKAYFGRQR